MGKPEPGFGTAAKVERVVDGDTVVVSLTRTFPLRILGLACPEHNKPGGAEATAAIQRLVNDAKSAFVFIHHADKYLTGINSFDRILGDLYLDDINVKQFLIDNGYCKAGNKEGLNENRG